MRHVTFPCTWIPHLFPHDHRSLLLDKSTMAPTVSRSYSQSKISDAFKSSTKSSKPLKQTQKQPQPVKSLSKTPSPVIASTTPQSIEDDGRPHLNPSDPVLVKASRAIESDRQAPFGMFLLCRRLSFSSCGKSEYYSYDIAKF